MKVEVTPHEFKVLEVLREPIEHETITIKKDKYGRIKRITIHREHDVYLEDKI